MNRTSALAIVPFAWMMIGAKDCDPWADWEKPPPAPMPSSTKPFCYTDPPLGCAAICKDVDLMSWTGPCSNIEAGPQTDLFEKKIEAAVNMAADQGIQLCTASNIGSALTPCMAGITPVEWPNQDHEVCTPAPPGCPL
jgi:hypothetical protein